MKRSNEQYINFLELQRERAAFQVDQVVMKYEPELRDLKLTTDNLAARLPNLTGGSSSWLTCQMELARAQKLYEAKTRECELEGRIAQRRVDSLNEAIKQAKEAPGKFRVLVIVLFLLELTVLLLALQYGDGDNYLQRIVNSLGLFPASLALWLAIFYWRMGLQGVRALGWPILKLLKEPLPEDRES